ncbi:MAG: MOSC domain-containing protein [Pseudomonadota bacterium]|nr:MOSC domain-containing protein [Pseudomonadota bacterium]
MSAAFAALSAIHRHPVKALGADILTAIELAPGLTLPGDRAWALAHEKSRFDFDAPAWARCSTFLRGATFPSLMAVTVTAGPAGLTFRHPEAGEVAADPATPEGEAALIAWTDRLIPAHAPRPARLAPCPGRGMTDNPNPWISILSDASLAELSARAGVAPDRRRFRGNLWIEGAAPWAEFDLVGRDIRLGGATLRVHERIERCSATHANPETGRHDADMLEILSSAYGHKDFGVFAEVLTGGPVAAGDRVEVLA